jgi:hypothetical protein
MTSLVIPVAVEPVNETLPIALWTASSFAPDLVPILIGEPIQLEPYLAEYPYSRILPFMGQGTDRQINTTRMLSAALEDDEITDPFVWSNDDIYFLRPTSLDDIRVAGATARKRLEENPPTGMYGRQAHLTLDVLRSLRKPTWDYERHVPILVHKERMRLALSLGPGAYPRSMYQNLAFERPAFIHRDVKAFNEAQLPEIVRKEQFFSSGNRFPIEAVRRATGWASAALDGAGADAAEPRG